MTHFITAVVTPAHLAGHYVTEPTRYPALYGIDALRVEPTKALADYLDGALAKFDEGREVEPYISETREHQLADEREKHADAAENLRRYRAGEKPYDRPANDAHIRYITTEAPELAKLDDDALWDHIVKTSTWQERDENGAIWSTYNPDSRWDWWVIGGRWGGVYRDRQGETVEAFLASLRKTKEGLAAGENLNPHKGEPHAVGGVLPWYFPHDILTTDQTWHRIGRTGWWGMRGDDMAEAEWVDHAIEALEKEDPAAVVYYLDLHI